MKHSINIPVDHEEKKINRVSWFTGIDLFPLVSIWIKVIDFIKIYILLRAFKLKVIRRHITGKNL